jgi:mRNA-degrading endonuclease RelE of RelBE toxin-antitoxin system
MRLRVSARFEKDLKALDATQRERVQKALRLFLYDPRHPSLHFEKLRGHDRLADLFELDRLGPHDLYHRLR